MSAEFEIECLGFKSGAFLENRKFMKIVISSAFCILSVFAFSTVSLAQNLKAQDVLAKHLESIGTEESRKKIKNRMAIGTSEFIVKVPYAKLAGKALMVSDEDNLFLLSSFNSTDYPFEKVGFFKNKVDIPFIKPGARSPLGNFLLSNSKFLSGGVLTGSISNLWILSNSQKDKLNLSPAGTKKIDGREAFVLNYVPKGGFSSDASVKLYFDAQTFQHLRTEFHQKVLANSYPIGIFGQSADLGTSNTFVEDFRDFKSVDGLVLPHSYKILLLVDSRVGTSEFEWNINISQYLFNQKLDADFFSFDKQTSSKD